MANSKEPVKREHTAKNTNQTKEAENLADTAEASGFTQVLYDAIANVFGVQNPYQMLALNWPATVLDQKALDWDQDATDNVIPNDVLVELSQILDTYVPFAPITQPDGTRVSDRYSRTIKQFGPIPNTQMLELQEVIRKKLKAEVTVNVNGEEKKMTIVEWFDVLYGEYIAEKRKWAEMQSEEKKRLRQLYPGDPDKQNNQYLEWYGIYSSTYLAQISTARNTLLAEFPLREWEAALSILDTGGNQNLQKAKQQVQNLSVNIPAEFGGGDYVPTFGVPTNWSTDLVTSVGKLDMLETPAAKFQALSNAIRSLESELMAWSAVITDIDDQTITDLFAKFKDTLGEYNDTRLQLSKEYSKSVFVVAEAAAAFITSFSTPQQKFVTAICKAENGQSLAENLANATHAAYGLGGGDASYERVTQLVGSIMNQQDGVWTKHDKAITAGHDLAGAAIHYLEVSGIKTRLKWIPAYIKQLEARLNTLKIAQVELMQSSLGMWKKLYNPESGKVIGEEGSFNKLADNIPADETAKALVPTVDYDAVGQINEFHSADPDTWTSVLLDISKTQMESNQQMSTYYSKRDWGVNFFFGSYRSSQESSGSTFASSYMSDKTNIKVGMLVKKVAIRRNWMDPSVLNSSEDFFRSGSSQYNLRESHTVDEILDNIDLQNQMLKCTLPSYPVAFLIAKDVSIKMNFALEKSSDIRTYAKSIASSGGGFFMFNSNSVNSSSNSYEDVTVNVDSGEIELKFKSPQIIGYYLQLTPPDESRVLNNDIAEEITGAFSFLNSLSSMHTEINNVIEDK